MDQNSLLVIIIVCIFGGVFLFVAMSPSSNLKNNYVGSDGRFINGSTDGAGFSNNVNISSCSLFGDAVPSDVFLGKTFYSDDTDTRLTGTFSLDGNVISSKMLSGYSGYGSSTSLIYGSMPIRVLSNLTPSFSSGYYDANDLNVIDTDLTGANISSGVTIFGIVGSASGGAELHSGQTTVYDSDGDDATNDGTAKSYTDNVDGTVTDNQTGLIWQKNHKDECSTLTWGGAIDYCESSTTGSYSDWRVPSNVELITLADYNYPSSSYLNSVFTQTGWNSNCFGYWSSTTVPSITSSAYTLYADDGSIYYYDKTFEPNYGVRCVRTA